MPRHCFALDLANDPELIAQYLQHHQAVWPEVLAAHRAAGVRELEIYRCEDRLVLIMDVDSTFSFERKGEIDGSSERVRAWEALMSRFQRPLPSAQDGAKWSPMKRIHHFLAESGGTG